LGEVPNINFECNPISNVAARLVIVLLISQIREGRFFLNFVDDPKIKPVYALYLNKEEMVNLDLGVKLSFMI
jgi:hypothetical protein